MGDKDLCLALEAAKGRRMDDPVLVTLKSAALGLAWLLDLAPSRLGRIRGVRSALHTGGLENWHDVLSIRRMSAI